MKRVVGYKPGTWPREPIFDETLGPGCAVRLSRIGGRFGGTNVATGGEPDRGLRLPGARVDEDPARDGTGALL